MYTVSHKNCTIFVSSITLSNVDRFWWFLHRCDYEVSIHKRRIEFATSPKLCCCTTV